MSNFVQLTRDDCQYLLELITDMDSDTPYTERQRRHTLPKLERIIAEIDQRVYVDEPTRLFYQDVDYLLDLIEDDELDETAQVRFEVRGKLIEIQALQAARWDEVKTMEQQRFERRTLRNKRSKNNDKER